VSEYLLNNCRVFDTSDDPDITTTFTAGFYVSVARVLSRFGGSTVRLMVTEESAKLTPSAFVLGDQLAITTARIEMSPGMVKNQRMPT